MPAPIAKVTELDGHVDTIGLGGIDVYLYAETPLCVTRWFTSAQRGGTTPVVDGSGLKNALEREAVRFMQEGNKSRFEQARADGERAESLRYGAGTVEAGADVLFGDFIFALDKDIAIARSAYVREMAEKYLPVRASYRSVLYQTGRNKINRRSRSIRNIMLRPISCGRLPLRNVHARSPRWEDRTHQHSNAKGP